jgi:polyhydroxyalkanoate synthesis regulator phasin
MPQNKNPLSQLASFGEDVLGKASKNPTASRVIQSANQLRDRVDDLSKRVRGLDVLERRVNELEHRVAKLEKPARRPAKPKTESKPETT